MVHQGERAREAIHPGEGIPAGLGAKGKRERAEPMEKLRDGLRRYQNAYVIGRRSRCPGIWRQRAWLACADE